MEEGTDDKKLALGDLTTENDLARDEIVSDDNELKKTK